MEKATRGSLLSQPKQDFFSKIRQIWWPRDGQKKTKRVLCVYTFWREDDVPIEMDTKGFATLHFFYMIDVCVQ